MSNHVMQSHHETKETTNRPLHSSSKSPWMAHWSRTSYKMESPQSHLPTNDKGKDKLFPFFGGPDTSIDVSNSSKESVAVPFVGTTNVSDEKSVTVLSRYSRNERDDVFAINNDKRATIGYGLAMGPPVRSNAGFQNASLVRKEKMLMWTPHAAEAREREHNINIADMLHDLKRQAKSLDVSSSFRDDASASSLKHVPYGPNFPENASKDWLGERVDFTVQGHFGNTNRYAELDSDQFNFHGGSAKFVHQKNLHARVSETEIFRKNDTGLDGPSTSKSHLSLFVDGKYQKSVDHLSGKFPFQNFSRSEDKWREYPSDNRNINRTTRQVFFTEKTDLEPYRGGQILRCTTASAQYSGSRFGEFFSSSDLAFQRPQGLKLQPLWSSTDSEENGKTADIINTAATKNEASAETDTMDLDVLNGDASSASDKEIEVSPKLQLSQGAGASTREEAGDDAEPTSSKTLSLDVERFLPRRTTGSIYMSGFSGPGPEPESEPESRWVKRLKTDSLAHCGTKSSKMEETETILPPEKINDGSYGKLLKQQGSASFPEPSMAKSHGKEQMEFLGRDGNSSSSGLMGRSKGELLSHSWIRRWCRNQAPPLPKKPSNLSSTLCEPQSFKASLNEFQKKQFPSVAAMALMGKAMNGFQPCEFSRRGSFVVWNT